MSVFLPISVQHMKYVAKNLCLHDIALGDTLSNKIKCFFAKNDTIQYSFQYFYPKFISKYHTIQYKLW